MKLKLLLFLFLALGSFFLIAASSAHAQTTDSSASANTNNLRNYYNTDSDVPPTLRTYIQSVFIEIASAISCQISGYDPINPKGKCLGVNPNTGRIGFVDGGGGAIAVVSSLIANTYYIPVNTHDYVVDVASNFGVSKKAYADNGIGYDTLIPTLALWRAFRNLTYMLFVLLFVIVGLGIMLRIKIDPRTVMTLQNQIPKIIMAIVFVTFSYAIAGFLIDLMYVSIYLAMSIFASAGIGVDTSSALSSNPFGAIGGLGGMSGIASGVAGSMSGLAQDIFSGQLGTRIAQVVGGILGLTVGGKVSGLFGTIGAFLGGAAGTAAAPGAGTAAGVALGQAAGTGVATIVGIIGGGLAKNTIVSTIASVLTYLIIIIALFSALLRLWFVLIKCYIYLLIGVVLGPFIIALGLLPNRAGIGNWVKSIISNLAVFPVTIIMFMLGNAFIQGFTNPPQGVRPTALPLVGDFSNPQSFGAIIGLAIILMTPEVANMVRETLKAPDFKYANAVGQGIGIAQKGVGALVHAPYEKLMERNKQTGKAQGWLARKVLGKNPLTRTIFNTDDFRTPKQKQEAESKRIERNALRRQGAGGIGAFLQQRKLNSQRQQMDAYNSGRLRNRPEGMTGVDLPNNPNNGGNNNGNPPPNTAPPGGPQPGTPPAGGGGTPPPGAPTPEPTPTENIEEAPHEETERPVENIPHAEPAQSGGGGSNREPDESQESLQKKLDELIRMQREGRGNQREIESQLADLEEKLKRLRGE